jgi:putative sterol carrier protein
VIYHLFTADWAEALRRAIDTDPAFNASGRDWKWPAAFVLTATPALGFPAEVAVQLTLDGGHCPEARILQAAEVTAPFVFRADYPTWKALAEGEIDALSAVMQRKVSFTGSLPRLLGNAAAAKALVACAQRVPTYFPDLPG